jgi:mRNA interferase MazF
MNRGQVYLLRLDPTEASEQAGTRPAVIVSRNAINQHSPLIVVCPMTDAAHVGPKNLLWLPGMSNTTVS